MTDSFPTIPPPPQRLLVFARLPEAGRVKTRLGAEAGEAKALAAYEAMLEDVLASVGDSDATTDVEVLWAPTAAASGDALARAFGPRSLAMQTGATLGDRLAMAFSERFFFHRTHKIIAIGVDEPRITRAEIDRAFELLDSCEWVIGPAEDGGYYLIGCRGPAFQSAIFQDVAWGSDTVLATTLARIREWNECVALLPPRYDLDTAADLRRYARERHSGALADLLATWAW